MMEGINQLDRNQMDFLDRLSDEEVTRVFHCKKTEMSCMEEPHTFLNQLRDYDLIPENLYKKVKKERCNKKKVDGVYQILDWLEKKRGNDIKLFWRCVFQEHVLKMYSVLRSLRDSFLNDAERKSREKTQTEIKPMKSQSEKSTEESKKEAGSPMLCEPMSDVQAECDDGEKTLNATLKEKINKSSISIFNNIQDAEMTSGKETENLMEAREEQGEISFENSGEEAGFSVLCELFSDVQAEGEDVEKTSNTTTKEKRNKSNEEMNEESERKCRENMETENTPTKEQRKKSIEESKEEAGSPMLCKPVSDVQTACDDGVKTSNVTTKEKRNENAEIMCRERTETENTSMKEQRENSTEESKKEAGSSMLCEPNPDVQAASNDKEKTLDVTAKEKRNESNEEMNKEAGSTSINNYIQDAEITSGKKMQSENTQMEEQGEKSIDDSEEEADAEITSGMETQSENSMDGQREHFTEEEAGSPMCELLSDEEAECEDEEKTLNAILKEKTIKNNEETNKEADVQAQCDSGKKTSKATTKEKRKESNKETSKRAGSPLQLTSTPKKKFNLDAEMPSGKETQTEISMDGVREKCTKEEAAIEQSENLNTGDLSNNLLPVTCGEKTGVVYRDKLLEGNECILSEDIWFTKTGFEIFGGKGSSRNWKLSIRSENIPLQKLIKDGKLKYIPRRSMKSQKQSPKSTAGNTSPESTSSEDSEESEDEEGRCVDKQMFKDFYLPVSCGSVCGMLNKERFNGPDAKSIRTDERWFSPEEFINQDLTLICEDWKKDILCHGKNFNYLLENKILSLQVCDPENQEHDNDDVCFICNDGGDLVCCDDCPRAFHPHCHIPALNDELRDHWTCKFCLETNQKSHMTEEAALNQPISDSIMHCEYLLLCLYKGDTRRMFTEDPTVNVRNPRQVIARTMWINQVRTKLENNEYRTVREFVQDVQLIFSPCKDCNKDSKFVRMGTRLYNFFESEFSKAFKIRH